MEGAKPSSPLPIPLWLDLCIGLNPKPATNVRQAHFKLNRTFKVIQGHPYLCWQEPRAVYCRNVQLMRRYSWNLRRYGNRNTSNSSISTTPFKFEDVLARNAFEYLQTIYIARNYSHWPTFLPLIVWEVFTYNYASKSNPLDLKLLVRKPSFTWNSRSRSS